MKKKLTQNEIKNKLQDLLDEIEDNEQDEESLKEVTEQIEEKVKGTYKKPKKGFVVSAVLYPLLILFLALLLGLLSMSDTRKRILDKMKLEIGDSLFDDGECSCETLSSKLDYLLQHGVGGGTSYSNNGAAVSVNGYETDGNLPNVGNNIGNIAVITDVEIANYYLSSVVPKEPRNGTVWIVQDRNSEYYLTSDTSKLGISYAMQYICDEGGSNCEWQIKKAYYFDNAKWNLLYYVPVSNGEVDLSGADVNAEIAHTYDYKGEYQTFHATFSGIYEVELWGAQGGSYNTSIQGGKGAYTKGNIYLDAGETLYIYVGGQGKTATSTDKTAQGGWNGGGAGIWYSANDVGQSGGGATDIRLVPTDAKTDWGKDNFDSLKSRIMVAAGGGGAYYWGSNAASNGGAGGALEGIDGFHSSSHIPTTYQYSYAKGGTQNKGGKGIQDIGTLARFSYDGGFGYGGDSSNVIGSYQGSGGGAGYYGGAGSTYNGNVQSSGAGGSSYISGYDGCSSIYEDSTSTNIMHSGSIYHYSNHYFTDTVMKNGENISTPTYDGNSIMTGNSGNGYAKIVLKNIEVKTSEQRQSILDQKSHDFYFTYSGKSEKFVAPYSGYYQIDLYGAQGGSYNTTYIGGKGAHTSGKIYLQKGTVLFVYVGEKGGSSSNNTLYKTISGGWNGGGSGIWGSANDVGQSGGGATDIRLVNTASNNEWNEFESLKSRIMVAAGGGGAYYWGSNGSSSNGAGGGTLVGIDGFYSGSHEGSTGQYQHAKGGNQAQGGIGVQDANTAARFSYAGGFGYGGDSSHVVGSYQGSGGGAGYFGGGGSTYTGEHQTSGAGGSSYISGYDGCSSIYEESTALNILSSGDSYHYSGYYFTNANMQDSINENNGKAIIKLVSNVTSDSREKANNSYSYYFNNGYQKFIAPENGTYKVETWGAQGGSYNTTYIGGKGAYTKGDIYLNKGETLYVYVGGQGRFDTYGYNGGGKGKSVTGYGGGGATDIRLVSSTNAETWNEFSSLKSRIMVAAGGGGAAYHGSTYTGSGGDAGGLVGYETTNSGSDTMANFRFGYGGTQTRAGFCKNTHQNYNAAFTNEDSYGGFGFGGDAVYETTNNKTSGGGGGYYGGGAGMWAGGVGGGGSSYISGHEGCSSFDDVESFDDLIHNGNSNHYTGKYFTNTVMIDGKGYSWSNVVSNETQGMPRYNSDSTMIGNTGDGYARITLITKGIKNSDELLNQKNERVYSYSYSGKYQEFTAPKSGLYKTELWGAQGGTYNATYIGGKGAYTSGEIYLNEGEKLYIYVGEQGGSSTVSGGWNGGGKGHGDFRTGFSGGGATDIRLSKNSDATSWNDFDSLKSRIMVAAGGGGSVYHSATYAGSGGDAGGLVGYQTVNGGSDTMAAFRYGLGATQSYPGYSKNITQNYNADFSNKDSYGGFGYGADSVWENNANNITSGGGGGYYGGGAGMWVGGVGGGGSSYISGFEGTSSINNAASENEIIHTGGSIHYSGKYFTNTTMIDGKGYKWNNISSTSLTGLPSYKNSEIINGSGDTSIYSINDGYARITYISNDTQDDISENKWFYNYAGKYQEFTAKENGYYDISLWGAQGGNFENSIQGGLGAYTKGKIYLKSGDKLYVYVGSQGYNPTAYRVLEGGGWNGGGNGSRYNTSYSVAASGGGGATDIRLVTSSSLDSWDDFDSLKSRIMVAAGGSGAARYSGDVAPGIAAGGLKGYDGTCDNGTCNEYYMNAGTGGTQTLGGTSNYYLENNLSSTFGSFGLGGDGGIISYSASGGGAGYFGGAGGSSRNYGRTTGGSGSSYISGFNGCNSLEEDSEDENIILTGSAYHYSNRYFTDSVMIDGKGYSWNQYGPSSLVYQPTKDGLSTQIGNSGNGYAIIKLVQKDEKSDSDINEMIQNTIENQKHWYYDYSKTYQIFTAPKAGKYSVKLWGAQGGSYNTSVEGGLGSYTYGEIDLEKGDTLYVYVGGQGLNPNAYQVAMGGGWNGGGNGNRQHNSNSVIAEGGGGATDVRLVASSSIDSWQHFDSLKSRIMVAAGGSGSARYSGDIAQGIAGGGITGYDGTCDNGTCDKYRATEGHATQSGPGLSYYDRTNSLVLTRGGFGNGGRGSNVQYSASGGGSGYFGGSGGAGWQYGRTTGGTGSSYISGYAGCNSIDESSTSDNIVMTGRAIHYSNVYFTNGLMIDGKGYSWSKTDPVTLVGQPTHSTDEIQTGNKKNGFAEIEYLNDNEATEYSDETWTYNYSGEYQTFTAPKTGTYKIELWGAQGGSYTSTNIGGLGAYTSGEIVLTKGTNLYVYVGGEGTNPQAYKTLQGGGWNGGGDGDRNNTSYSVFAEGGGGATDVRTIPTGALKIWNDEDSLSSRIMVAAGGSGAARYNGDVTNGVAGGGLVGYTGFCDASVCTTFSGSGGTQISGGFSPSYPDISKGHFGSGGSAGTVQHSASGGGSGWYGGGGGSSYNNGRTTGGGGSSYISGHEGCIAVNSAGNAVSTTYTSMEDSISHTGYKFVNTVMIDGKGYQWHQEVGDIIVKQPTYDGLATQVGNSGDGFAKISYLGE